MKQRSEAFNFAAYVESWRTKQIAAWLAGLGGGVPTASVRVETGSHLLLVDGDDLSKWGVAPMGKRKMLTQAIQLLRHFCYEAPGENLETLCASLSSCCEQVVACINDISIAISHMAEEAKRLVFWLDRSPFDAIPDYIEIRNRVVSLCAEIVEMVNEQPAVVFGRAVYVAKKLEELGQECESVLIHCDDPLVLSTSYLERARLTRPDASVPWGIDLQSSYRGVHVVNEVKIGSPADLCGKVDAGDEVFTIDEATVIGWDLGSVAQALKTDNLSVVLIVRKRPQDSPSLAPKAPRRTPRPLKLAPGSLRPTLEGDETDSLKVPFTTGTVLGRRRSSTFVQAAVAERALKRRRRRASVGGVATLPPSPTSPAKTLERPTHLHYDLLSVDTQRSTHVVHRTRTMRHQPNGYTRSFIDNKVVRDGAEDDEQLPFNVPCPSEFAEISVASAAELSRLGFSDGRVTDAEWSAPISSGLRPFRATGESALSTASHDSPRPGWEEGGAVSSPSAWSTGSPMCVLPQGDLDAPDSSRPSHHHDYEGWVRRRKTGDESGYSMTNKWPKVWMKMVGNHLYIYNDQHSKKPTHMFCLTECTVSPNPSLKTSKKNVFALSRSSYHFYFSCYSPPDFKGWLRMIKMASKLPCDLKECQAKKEGMLLESRHHSSHSHGPSITLDLPTPSTPDTPASYATTPSSAK